MEANGTATNGHTPDLQRLREQKEALTLEAEIDRLRRRRRLADQAARLEGRADLPLADRLAVRQLLEGIGWADDDSASFGGSDLFYRLRYGPDENGTLWVPPANVSDRKQGAEWPLWRNLAELDRLRQQSRILSRSNAYGRGLLKNTGDYVVGTGFTYKAQSKEFKDADPDKPGVQNPEAVKKYVRQVQDVLDEFCRRNRWNGMVDYKGTQVVTVSRERELYRRVVRDGEAFLRLFREDDGRVTVRFLEPEQLRDPPNGTAEEGWSFGIRHQMEPYEDVETPLEYYAKWQDDAGRRNPGEFIPADEIIHVKDSDTDAAVKRGLPQFSYDTADALERGRKLQRNISVGSAVRAATAEYWQYENATAGQVGSLAAGRTEFTRQSPTSGQNESYERRPPGGIGRIPAGVQLVAPPYSTGVEEQLAAVQGDLRQAGASFCAPEYMVSGDASNNSYASTKEAGAPFVKWGDSEQGYFCAACGLVAWKAVEWAAEKDLVAKEALDLVDINVTGPAVLHRDELQDAQKKQIEAQNKVLSPQTWMAEAGRDPEIELANIEEFQQRMAPPAPPGMGGLDQGPGGTPDGGGAPDQGNSPPGGDGAGPDQGGGDFGLQVEPVTEAKDASGHEHKGKGPGGGQFAPGSGGGASSGKGVGAAVRGFGHGLMSGYYHTVADSIKKTGDVPKAERAAKSNVAQAWDMVKQRGLHKLPDAAERFTAAAQDAGKNGATDKAWADALNKHFADAAAAKAPTQAPAGAVPPVRKPAAAPAGGKAGVVGKLDPATYQPLHPSTHPALAGGYRWASAQAQAHAVAVAGHLGATSDKARAALEKGIRLAVAKAATSGGSATLLIKGPNGRRVRVTVHYKPRRQMEARGDGDGDQDDFTADVALLEAEEDAPDDSGDPRERAELICDVLAHVFGADAEKLFDALADSNVQESVLQEAWAEIDHPRGKHGRFIPKNSPEAVAAAHDQIQTALKAPRTPESFKALAEHLSILTVAQLNELKRKHGIAVSAGTRAALAEKIADRLDRGRRAEPEPKAAANPAAALAAFDPPEGWLKGRTYAGPHVQAPSGFRVVADPDGRGFLVKDHEGKPVGTFDSLGDALARARQDGGGGTLNPPGVFGSPARRPGAAPAGPAPHVAAPTPAPAKPAFSPAEWLGRQAAASNTLQFSRELSALNDKQLRQVHDHARSQGSPLAGAVAGEMRRRGIDPNRPALTPSTPHVPAQSIDNTSSPDYNKAMKPGHGSEGTGKPFSAEVYQGTSRADASSVYRGGSGAVLGPGARYFALTPDQAKGYGPEVKKQRVELKSPLVLSSEADWRKLAAAAGVPANLALHTAHGGDKSQVEEASRKLTEFIKGLGHDGVVVKNSLSTKYLQQVFGHDQVVAF